MTEGKNLRFFADFSIPDNAVCPDAHAVCDSNAPLEHAVDVDFHILAAFQTSANVNPRRVDQRHTGIKKAAGLFFLPDALETCELRFGIHSLDLPDMPGMNRCDPQPLVGCEADNIREVVLALRIRSLERREPAVKP